MSMYMLVVPDLLMLSTGNVYTRNHKDIIKEFKNANITIIDSHMHDDDTAEMNVEAPIKVIIKTLIECGYTANEIVDAISEL